MWHTRCITCVEDKLRKESSMELNINELQEIVSEQPAKLTLTAMCYGPGDPIPDSPHNES